MITSEEIIASLQIIMSTATKSRDDKKVKDNDYFKRRVLGFKAEIEFEKFINLEFKNTIEFLEGGQFISKKYLEIKMIKILLFTLQSIL